MTTPRLARRRVVQTGLATAALTPWQRTAEPAAAATPDRTFTVATFNVRAGQPARVYAESLRALMTRAALIGLQETHSPKFARALRRVLAEPRFAGWSATGPPRRRRPQPTPSSGVPASRCSATVRVSRSSAASGPARRRRPSTRPASCSGCG
ncbi:MAG: hypothetical protein R2731_08220 [Nocardioides sp.]